MVYDKNAAFYKKVAFSFRNYRKFPVIIVKQGKNE